MAINKIKATLYQDNKRNTATCYLKFNNIKEEIFLGFTLNTSSSSYENKSAKTKISKTVVKGIYGELIPATHGDFLVIITIGDDEYAIRLDSTGDYPITHKGSWENTIAFTDWLAQQLEHQQSVNITDILNENQ